MDEQKWQVGDLWKRGDRVLLAMEPKCGNTWLACSIAVAIARGERLWDRFAIEKPEPVVIWTGDEDVLDVSRKVDRLSPGAQGDGERITVTRFLGDPEGGALDQCRRDLGRLEPALLILDRVLPPDHWNDAGKAGGFLANAADIGKENGCSVLLVHHLRKEDGPTPWDQRIRGSAQVASWPNVCLLTSGPYRSMRGGRVDLDVRGRRPNRLRSFGINVIGPETATETSPLAFKVGLEERWED